MASRNSSYKVKSTGMDKREKKLLRVHRRSIDQREQRQDEMNKRRQLDNMSPVVESADGSKNASTAGTPKPATQKAALARLEMLKKWKEERELKRKLEALEKARNKPGFKITHVTHSDNQLFVKDRKTTATGSKQKAGPAVRAAKPGPSKTKPTSVKPVVQSKAPVATAPVNKPSVVTKSAAALTTRVTRSRAAAVTLAVSPASKKLKSLPSKAKLASPRGRGGKNHFMAPTAASRTRAASNTSKASTKKPKHDDKAKDTSKVSTQRGDRTQPVEGSFAPNDFVFEAPENVSSFVFKPLSPSSAASFLYPNGNSTTMSAFTDRVGRTSTPKKCQTLQDPEKKLEQVSVKNVAEPKKPGDTQTVGEESAPVVITPGSTEKIRRSAAVGQQQEKVSNVRMTPSSDSGIEMAAGDTDTMVPAQDSTQKNILGSVSTDVASKEASEEPKTKCLEQVSSELKEAQTPTGRRRSSRILQHSTPAKVEKLDEQQPPANSASRRRSTRRQSKSVHSDEQPAAQENQPDGDEKSSSRRRRRSSTADGGATNQDKTQTMEVVQEEDVAVCDDTSKPEQITETQAAGEGKTPKRARHSRKSSVAGAEGKAESDAQPMEVEAELEPVSELPPTSAGGGRTPGRVLRCSRRSSVAAALLSLADSTIDPSMPADSTPKRSRRSRRSSVAQVQAAVQPADEKETSAGDGNMEPHTSISNSSAAAVPEQNGDVTEETADVARQQDASLARTRGVKRGLSKDDGFLTPGMPVSAQRRSTAKRRRTATMIALSTAKSPEEAIQIISSSPMVEMTRRTPKSKTPPGLNTSTNMFDDVDLLLAKPVRLFAESSDDKTSLADELAAASSQQTDQADTDSSSGKEEETVADAEKKRDVTPFREQHSAEIQKLTALADKWSMIEKTTTALSEDVQGQIRTVACQARLLMGEKLKQFLGLVDKCEAGDPYTNCQDLQGFWDMVYIQAEDVYQKFENLDKLQQNNWKIEEIVVKKTAQKMAAKKKAVGPKKDKPAGKSKFAEFRAQMQKQRKAREAEGSSEEKVFDAGFFKVSSPVRTPQYHCEGGTPKKRKTPSPRHAAARSDGTPFAAPSEKPSSETAAAQYSSLDDKENIHKSLLRRSVGGTPLRRSYLPAVPSPLLQDITHREDASMSASGQAGSKRRSVVSTGLSEMTVTDGGDDTVLEMATDTAAPTLQSSGKMQSSGKKSTPRRSTRTRKSVCFADSRGEKVFSPESNPTTSSEEEPVDLMAYFQPSTTVRDSPQQVSSVENSPFSCDSILLHSGKNSASTSPSTNRTTPNRPSSVGRRKSSLKKLPSAERRRSRRSVSFAASPRGLSHDTFYLPSTPYNRNSLVAGRRVSRQSLSSSPGESAHNTTQPRRSARPSLLYTPPDMTKPQRETLHKDVPVATLISLSP